MEAIILAGGLGTRLRDAVPDVPKPMAPIEGRPFLEILLNSLAHKGFSKVVLSVGYMAEKISNHFGSNFGSLEIKYVVDEFPLGTGGATRLAADSCSQDHVFVFNGDTYLDLEVELVENQWRLERRQIIVGRRVPDTLRFGRLIIEDKGISGFAEKGIAGPGLINAGCYVLETNSLSQFPLHHPFSIETDYLVPEIGRGAVDVFVTDGVFIDIGIPEDYRRAQELLANR